MSILRQMPLAVEGYGHVGGGKETGHDRRGKGICGAGICLIIAIRHW